MLRGNSIEFLPSFFLIVTYFLKQLHVIEGSKVFQSFRILNFSFHFDPPKKILCGNRSNKIELHRTRYTANRLTVTNMTAIETAGWNDFLEKKQERN